MKQPDFDDDKYDGQTFAPFSIQDLRDSEGGDVRLIFGDWDWFRETHGEDTIDDYYFNGYGVQGLVQAARHKAGMEVMPDSINYNSEGDTCFIQFEDFEDAVKTANLSAEMINDGATLREMIAIAREHGYED